MFKLFFAHFSIIIASILINTHTQLADFDKIVETSQMQVNDYKTSLNLPTTDFPMKANLAQREPGILQKWQELDIYKQMLDSRDKANSFVLTDGPPYANGDIHIGHALNKILKDIVVKAKHLSGCYAPYVPGWDCHGLPIELQVEKKFGKPGVKLTVDEFRQKCREYAAQQIDIQRASFKRLGVFGDWENPYTTMNPKFEASVIRTLAKILANGHLARGERPVHWCVECGSALAEAEVEYIDKTSDEIYVKFALIDTNKIIDIFDAKINPKEINVLIWTTTPWTLPANQAVAISGDADYVLAKYNDEFYIVAAKLSEKVFPNAQILATTKGNNLENLLLQHPFYERQVPLILGEHVTMDAGTGCVHTAPAHGNDDYLIGRHYNLEIDNPVNANGCFKADTPLFANLHVFKANPEVIKVLAENKRLFAQDQITHSYPHCWRHKLPLIFRATAQWFVSMDKNGLRKTALNEIQKVKWFPKWGMARISEMVGNRPDWCISRQRTWGTPLALIVHKDTNELHPNMLEILSKVADMVETGGIEAWFNIQLEELIGKDDAAQYIKVNDTLDVWFDSGAVYAYMGTADMYLEGSDQHRGWFQTSLLSSVAVNGHAPYKQVLTHGFTVDAAGKKMSKSLGNVVAPEKVMKSLGADILRLWVAATDYSSELRVSDEILKRISDAYRRIRNTTRFLLANLADFDPKQHSVASGKLLKLDSWLLGRIKQLQQEIIKYYDNNDFIAIYQQIHNFCSYELGSFYLDVIKDRQYTAKTDGLPRRSAQTAMYHTLECLLRWIAPILSFTAEEAWSYMPGERSKSVFLNTWYENIPEVAVDNSIDADFWPTVLKVRDEVNRVLEESRKTMGLGSNLEAEVVIHCDARLEKTLSVLGDELRFVLITSAATLKSSDSSELKVDVKISNNAKCERCWHRVPSVDSNPDYPGICARCVENLSEQGEMRTYA